jgi:hypothetical protein
MQLFVRTSGLQQHHHGGFWAGAVFIWAQFSPCHALDTCADRTHVIEVQPGSTVADVKAIVQAREGELLCGSLQLRQAALPQQLLHMSAAWGS